MCTVPEEEYGFQDEVILSLNDTDDSLPNEFSIEETGISKAFLWSFNYFLQSQKNQRKNQKK